MVYNDAFKNQTKKVILLFKSKLTYFCVRKYEFMGRNNERNIKKHNDKLHKAQDKVKQAEILRKEKLKAIVKKFNTENHNSNE